MSNSENIQLLREILIDEQKKVAAFVGSGPSQLLGIEGWGKILDSMKSKFNSSIDIKTESENGYPFVASKIFKEKSLLQEQYYDFMRKEFEPKNTHSISLTNSILKLFRIILTTNFDSSFESAFEDLNDFHEDSGGKRVKLNKQILPDFNPFSLNNINRSLVYLHGYAKKGPYIFLQEEYEMFYPSIYNSCLSPDKRLEDLLRPIFKNFSLVFIGFSFDDAAFVQLFREVKLREMSFERKNSIERLKIAYADPPISFAFISNESLIEKRNNIEKRDILNELEIKLITYDRSKRIEIENIMKELYKQSRRISISESDSSESYEG